jgi:hypothetical protein
MSKINAKVDLILEKFRRLYTIRLADLYTDMQDDEHNCLEEIEQDIKNLKEKTNEQKPDRNITKLY